MTEPMTEQPRQPIVVGVDGSTTSIDALRWSAQQARLTGAEVRAVTAWEVPVTLMMAPMYTQADYARQARDVLERAVAEVQQSDGDVHIEKCLMEQRPALALVQAAQHAQLLVVGSHGRGQLPGLHLGSVATYCVHHAPCPVVVVRASHGGR